MLASMTEDMTSENPSKIKTALKRNIADHIQLKDAMIKNKLIYMSGVLYSPTLITLLSNDLYSSLSFSQ